MHLIERGAFFLFKDQSVKFCKEIGEVCNGKGLKNLIVEFYRHQLGTQNRIGCAFELFNHALQLACTGIVQFLDAKKGVGLLTRKNSDRGHIRTQKLLFTKATMPLFGFCKEHADAFVPIIPNHVARRFGKGNSCL